MTLRRAEFEARQNHEVDTRGVLEELARHMLRAALRARAERELPGLRFGEGDEVAWVERIDGLSPESRQALEDDLAGREFMPVIQRIRSVSSFATPSTWEIDTDRGPTTMVLKGEEDIRRLVRPALLIADSRGINFLIRDRYALDPVSKKMLDRFL